MKRVMCVLCTAVVIAAAEPLYAQIFKCRAPNGTVVYQDGPCAGGERVETHPAASGVTSPKGSSSAANAGSKPIATKPTHPVLPEKMRR